MVRALLALAVLPASTAATEPRLPVSSADWATFSPSERQAALAYVRAQFDASMRSGLAVIHTVGQTPSGATAETSGVAALAVTVTYSCPIQWVDQAQGSYLRGGGWTTASSPIYYLAASRVLKKGQFLKDGVIVGNWYNETTNDPDAHAESWTSWNFKWWFEHFNYVNKGWHGARQTNGGTWQLGPDRFCTVSHFH